ncbi:talin-1-like [Trichoplusia ni]|uniref:Talin-1-like n=2 Tax=Plusiinae TaxID=95186 RepID=A0A7E5W063_TRINI|nr:talin-1-like [Trichoplusia ni]
MPSLSLKIVQDNGAVTRKVKFDSRMTVQEAHKVVKEKVIVPDNKEYALFLRSADDDLTGVWLENERNLDYYMLRDGDSLDYICKVRNLRVRLLDGTVKTLQVEEASTVIELLFQVCARIGITNHDEYGLCREEVAEEEEGKEPVTGTLTRKAKVQQRERDELLEQMSKRLKTDDNVEWLDQHRTLREQGVDPSQTVLLKRRLFFSDRNVDARDPVQLNLLYVQTRDAILNGRHPVTEQQAVEFAGIQCQVHFGDYQEKKHKPGFLENLEEYLPKQYSNAWGVEKKIHKAYSQHQGVSHLDAKYLYIKTARDLPTYGVTFFVVKEKQKDKKKLVPRLLGINAQAILRLDEVTKEILQTWPLTHVKTYHAGKSQFFTLNFGDYSDKEYSVKTKDALRIRDILEGYIDIIGRRMRAQPTADTAESMAIMHDNIQTGRSHIIQHMSHNTVKVVSETFVGPTKILPYDTGSQAQQGTQIMSVQQIVVTDHLQNKQHALKGEVPLRGVMSDECVRKLRRMNSNSVKIVTLLTDPTDVNVQDAQKIVANMQEDFPEVEKGVIETAEKQTIDEAKKMLQDELQDLKNYLNKLTENTKQGNVNPADAKESAEYIADVTAQLYLSTDPKTRKGSEILRRSRKSLKAGERTERATRRVSLSAAAAAARRATDRAASTLRQDYDGEKLNDAERRQLEKALQERMGKLNAAIALFLTAYSDPKNVDYDAAINSMNNINELMPELARDAQILGSSMDDAGRQELQDDMRTLLEATGRLCAMDGSEDHEKMQEASNNYADIAGKLIFTFARGTNAADENEIIELAKTAGDKASLLLVLSNELACQAGPAPAAQEVKDAGARAAAAARDLLACAQLTAPAIHEAHCRSALWAASAGLRGGVQQLQAAARPLLEAGARLRLRQPLHARAADVHKALDKLQDAYTALGDDIADASLPLQERQRLRFIHTMAGAKNKLQGVEDLWNKSATAPPSERDMSEARRRLSHQMAQLNAAVAALTATTADPENPDYATVDLAISTISELMPQIVKDSELVSSDKDEATRAAMLRQVRGLCAAARDLLPGAGELHGQSEAASNFAAASGKLVFLVSPGADKGKGKYVVDTAGVARDQLSELVSQAQRVGPRLPPAAAAELDAACARAGHAAHALLPVAQVTAPSLHDPRCQDALTTALVRARTAASDLVSCTDPHLQDQPELQDLLLQKRGQLEDSLEKIAQAMHVGQQDRSSYIPTEQERQRLQFISSTAGAKNRLEEAQQQLDQPLVSQPLPEAAASPLQHKLWQRLAQLNAAVASLAAATADRENPDYAGAQQAVATISEMMPGIVQDSRTLCGTKSETEQAQMLQDLRALCEATRELCDNAGEPQGLGVAAAKFSAATGNLVFCVSPSKRSADREQEVIELSSAACGKASELLSRVQTLEQQLQEKDPAAASELDARGARTADAAQALLTVAQLSACSIADAGCAAAVKSAAEVLRGSARALTESCRGHAVQDEGVLLRQREQLEDAIDRLLQACKKQDDGPSQEEKSAQQEKKRLQFISSVSGAKSRLDAAEQQLSQPLVCQLMHPQAGSALQHKLWQRLAQLNAAVASLAAATADREHPDYAAAEYATKTISELMPDIVQDSRTLCGTKSETEQAQMLQDLRALCEATRELCDNAGQSQGLGEAAAKFSAASGNLVFCVSPSKRSADREQQVIELSAAACGKASELLSRVQTLEQQLQEKDPATASELDARGAKTADAAQALLAVAQVSASSIADAGCAAAVTSAAEVLRGSARALTESCRGHAAQDEGVLLEQRQELEDAIDRLLQACKKDDDGPSQEEKSAQQEKKRLQFISSVSGAKSRLDAAEQQLSQPLVCQLMQPAAGSALQNKLWQRLAQLNAAVASLAAATADRENPDYPSAEDAVRTITELMPSIVQDSRTLCGTKDEAGQAAMLKDLKALCEASKELCDGSVQQEGLGEAAAKFSAASGSLVFLVSPSKENLLEQQVIDLTSVACGKASELLSQVQTLEQQLQEKDPAAAAELDARGARTADAAQALLAVAQVTAPSLADPACGTALSSAVEVLRQRSQQLTASCQPHADQQQQETLATAQQTLENSLQDLLKACYSAQSVPAPAVSLSPQQDKQRLKFISTVSRATGRLDAAEQQLEQPQLRQLLKPEDSSQLQQQLSGRCQQLDAAAAALATATQDAKNPDYAAAERAVITITELMPQITYASRAVSSSLDAGSRAALLQQAAALCGASRALLRGQGQPHELHDASTKLANASNKLLFIIDPGHKTDAKQTGDLQAASKPVPGVKPAVPARGPAPAHAADTQAFLNRLRQEEIIDNKARVVSMTRIDAASSATQQYARLVEDINKQLDNAEKELKQLSDAASTASPRPAGPSALAVWDREQRLEDALARAAQQLAALVAANYTDKLDYTAATQPTVALSEAVKSIVDDGGVISGSLQAAARRSFLQDLLGLCHSTRAVCEAASKDRKKLNDSAIAFGNQSAKLLRVVSSDVNRTMEKEVISRAKAIGDTASRVALEAGVVAADDSVKFEDRHVQDICTAGAACVDAAGKLVYTAKLVAPTIHHTTCQNTLTSSADSLSSSLTAFSKTLTPLTSAQHPGVQKLVEETRSLEELVAKLKSDVKAGDLGRRREVDRMVELDTPLRQMTVQIIDNARNMSEYGDISPDLKQQYAAYSSRLAEALHALDLANARYQRAAHDKEKREQMEIAVQDLQMTLLQTRPSRVGQERNNIVDFRDFLQDLVKESDDLQESVKQHEGLAGKRTAEDINLLCSKISEDANKLMFPEQASGEVTVLTSVDDVADIDHFGQECDVLVKEINSAIQGIQDQKTREVLRAKALPLTESCHLLRFATNCHISATKTAAFDEVLRELDNFEEAVIQPIIKDVMMKKEKKSGSPPAWSARARRGSAGLVLAARAAAAGRPHDLCRALTHYAAETAREAAQRDTWSTLETHMNQVLTQVHDVTSASCLRLANWDPRYSSEFTSHSILKNLNDLDYKFSSKKLKTPVLNDEDIDKLLLCQRHKVQGTQSQLQAKLQQLSTQLGSLSGGVLLSVRTPDSLGRSLHAAAEVAAQLADTARGLKDQAKPAQCTKIEDAAHEMCLATYTLMKTAEVICQNPNHHNARRRLLDACHHLNDTINQLVRSVNPTNRVSQECSELHRSLQLQRSMLQATPQPCGALPYDHCLDTLQSQREVLLKMNSDQAMSREEFLKSMHYVGSAVNNSTDCAAHAAYLVSVSEKDASIGKQGIVDVPKLSKSVQAAQDSCVSIIIANNEELIYEEQKTLEGQVEELLSNLESAHELTRSADLKLMLKKSAEDVQFSAKAYYNIAKQDKPKDVKMSLIMSLLDDISSAGHLLEHPDLVPIAAELKPDTHEHCQEVTKSSLELLKNTEDLIKEVKTSEQPEVMKWVVFNKRRDVLESYDVLLKIVKTVGQQAKLLQATEEPEEEKKSYVQKQFETASRWLSKPITKAEVKTNGQQAVRNLIEVANKVSEDLKGADKDDMKHMVMETEQLLTECCKKYDHEQYSVLLERIRDVKKAIERGVVTRVVEDFMEAEAPLQDLHLLAEHEPDETKRKFILEKKIAELLAQLGRVTKTARLIADTDERGRGITQCSQQAELLAPMLVKAAQQRVAAPDDKAAIEKYQELLAQYAESLSKIRDLCDQSVDPMDFVQTAGETMQRMRDESKTHNDPMKCAHTSAAITKLANRVIHVGLSSPSARADPELQRSLAAAQAQLQAAAPAPGARASRLPDWKDTTAKILQATDEVESLLGGDSIFKQQPEPNQPIYNEALNLHVAIRDWSSRDNEIVAVAKRMAVLMAKLSNYMNNDKQREVLATSKSIVQESHEVARLAKKLAHECTDHRIKTNLLQTCQRIPTISGQLKMLTTVKGFSLGRHGTQEDKEAMDMLVGNAQSLMLSIQDVVKVAASASVKIMSQRGPRMKWVRRKTSY